MKIYANGNTCEIHMTKAEAASCSHSGPCDDDCKAMVKKHPVMVKRMKREVLISAFFEYGAWTLAELQAKSDMDLWTIAIWVAACDIADNPDAHGWTTIDGSYGIAHPEYLQGVNGNRIGDFGFCA